MGLLPLADLAPSLACPRCRSGVERDEAGWRCAAAACALRAPGSFPAVGGRPVLVDFERSILARDEVVESPAGQGLTPRRWAVERLPRGLRAWWKPPNRVAARNLRALLDGLDGDSPRVLVVGGGTVGNGVEVLYAEGGPGLVAFDVYASPLVQLVADAHRIPLADASVDAAVVQAVLEHVLEPADVVREVHRVLRPGGLVYAETPFLQPVHAGPYDFTRFTLSGHRWLFRGFEEIGAGTVAGPGSALLASADHLVRGLARSPLAGRLARAALTWLRALDRLVPAAYAADDASAHWFLGRRADAELTPRDVVAYYRGAQGGARPAGTQAD